MQKQTSRQLQAQKTKRKIYNAATDLFSRHGFDNTTIEDISRKAGVSVGAFYHYYPSKSEIYSELYKKIDVFYENTIEAQLVEEDFYDNVIIFFRHYAAYNSVRGTDAVKQLFNTLSVLFLDKERYMYRLLLEIIKRGEAKNQLTKDMTVNEIEEFLLVVARGVIYDWLLHEGDYDLEERMVKYISEMRHIFVL
ncbi:MAG: TetR/AcrR family transcriptional regulator [Eubacteriales bacterium]|nr:TetR/AcrR family transcriptional regulator [Eubacteriales bacterium]